MVALNNPYPTLCGDYVYEWTADCPHKAVAGIDIMPQLIEPMVAKYLATRMDSGLKVGYLPEIATARSQGKSLWVVYIPLVRVVPPDEELGRDRGHITISLKRYIMAADSNIHPGIAKRGVETEAKHSLLGNPLFKKDGPVISYGPFTDYKDLK